MKPTRVWLVILSLGLASCAAKRSSSSSTTPEPAPTEATTYTEPAAYEEGAPTALPGSYQEGLGNPVIRVVNKIDTDLSLHIVDGSGYAYDFYIPIGTSQDVVIYPGVFSFTAAAGESSLNGEHIAEYDNGYEWEFAYE